MILKAIFCAIFICHLFGMNEAVLKEVCENDEFCINLLPNTICDQESGKCECQNETVYTEEHGCLNLTQKIGEKCIIDEQCKNFVSGKCVDYKCVAEKDNSTRENKCDQENPCDNEKCQGEACVKAPPVLRIEDEKLLGKYCKNNSECGSKGITCLEDKCACDQEHVESENLKLCLRKAKKLGDNCTESVQCVALNGAICREQKCEPLILDDVLRSTEQYVTGPAVLKAPLLIGSNCKEYNECQHMVNAICRENVCQCKDEYVTSESSDSCLRKAKMEGDSCAIDKQCETVEGGSCINKICVKLAPVGRSLESSSNHGSSILFSPMAALSAAILILNSFCSN